MTPTDYCPACGAERTDGRCPRCLIQMGLEGQSPPLPGTTLDFRPMAGDGNGGRGGAGVLATLAATVGPIPRVLLRDTEGDSGVEPLVQLGSPEMPDLADRAARLRLLGEIARGGMGAVLKGRDEDLGRDLAVKVLLEKHRDHPELVRRFIEEAQIGGQLQHPGIVPVYELGAFADRRPYFAMKLVKGRTLADLLADRGGPEAELPRLLGIFEQVCQTVAYAHARGVIHRDLKPSNIMVGGFGEVQVMDWGLAKVLSCGAGADDPSADSHDTSETLVATVRGRSDSDRSRAGAVMGTPAYMAPEQARGKVDLVDERADVFALGAILGEILTGAPAFVGQSSAEIQGRAARGDTADALARLDACGAEAELIGLAHDCLAVALEDRPRDAGVVARRVTAYLTGVQQRLRAAELERARAEAHAAEERRRRKLQLGLAASILALTTLGGLSFTYAMQQRQAQTARVGRLLAEATLLSDQARAQPEEVTRWETAHDALARLAEDLGDVPALLALRQEVQEGLDTAEADRVLLERLVDIRSAQADDPDGSATDAAYADAFGAVGIDPDGEGPAEAGSRIARRPASVARELVAALDHWTAVRRARDAGGPGWRRLLAAARAADPDPDRDAMRAALLIEDEAERRDHLRPLAERADAEAWAPASLVLLGNALANAGDVAAGVAVLRRASGAHPSDAQVHYGLGRLLERRMRPPQWEEALRAYAVARGLQPELAAHELAHVLADRGRGLEAEAVWRDLIRRRPDNGRHLRCFGLFLNKMGHAAEAAEVCDRAVAVLRESIRRKPDFIAAYIDLGAILCDVERDYPAAEAVLGEALRRDPDAVLAHLFLGNVLRDQGRLDEAIAAYRETIRLNSDHAGAQASAYKNLGDALRDQGKTDEAVAALREALRLDPDYADVHKHLGVILCDVVGDYPAAEAAFREAIRLDPKDASAHHNLGIALNSQDQLDEALAAFREALRLDPDGANAHKHLGVVLRNQGKLDEAIAALRETVRLAPDDAYAHHNLGDTLRQLDQLDEAITAYHQAIQIRPDHAEDHICLGHALFRQGKQDEAIAAYREAIRLRPDFPPFHNLLGNTLRHQGKLDEAITAYREAIRWKPDFVQAHHSLGDLLRDQGRLDEAVAAYHQAIQIRPDHAEDHHCLGLAWIHQGKLDEAIAAYRQAIHFDPNNANAHYDLGNALYEQWKIAEAMAAYREALRLKPDYAQAHCNLGFALRRAGDFAGSLPLLRRGHELGSQQPGWSYPSADWVEEAERMAALAEQLPDFLGGAAEPADNAERLILAQMCHHTKHHAAAARLWAEAFEAEPSRADDLEAGHRYNAAATAALAGCGEGRDEPPPDDDDRAMLRRQALEWLRANLALRSKQFETDTNAARAALTKWTTNPDLAGVRDPDALAALPEAEREAWQALWAEVDDLLESSR